MSPAPGAPPSGTGYNVFDPYHLSHEAPPPLGAIKGYQSRAMLELKLLGVRQSLNRLTKLEEIVGWEKIKSDFATGSGQGSSYHKKRGWLRKYALQMRAAAQRRSPWLYGILHDSHRSDILDSPHEPKGIVYIARTEHPILGGYTDEYGPRLHKRRPWFRQTVEQDWPRIAKGWLNDYKAEIKTAVTGTIGV